LSQPSLGFRKRNVNTWNSSALAKSLPFTAGTPMVPQDYPDELIVLPCWPENVAVDFTLCSRYAGRVAVQYRPSSTLRVATQREIRVRTAIRRAVKLQVERLPADGR